jgi:hypothetical protein
VPAEVPVRLQILRALCAHLEGIVGPDWGDFDLSGKVFRGVNRFGEESPETFLSILEAPRPDSGRQAGENEASRSAEWPLFLQGWTKDDPRNPSDPCYYLLDQIEHRLAMIVRVNGHSGLPVHPDVYLLGGLITSFQYGPGVVRPPTDGISSKTYLYMPLRVGLATVV